MRERDRQTLEEIIAARGGFGHTEHLELAWAYLDAYGPDEAADVMTQAIRHLAAAHGSPGKYHETVTRAWVHFVAVHRQRWGTDSFETFLAANPDLLDRHLAEHYYSRDTIFSDTARATWVEPDLHPLPALAA